MGSGLATSDALSGMSSSLAFTPIQGIELVNSMARVRVTRDRVRVAPTPCLTKKRVLLREELIYIYIYIHE